MKAIVFPGQGSQTVGMGKAFYDNFSHAREVFEEVNEALGENLTKLIFEGPQETLTLTENAQPALMAVSMAILRVMEKDAKIPVSSFSYAAGHSLGEYSALAAVGTFSLADTARLLRIRGRAMQDAVPVGKGAMAALLGVEVDAVRKLLDEKKHLGVCVVANDNAPGQVVISGELAAVEAMLEAAKEIGARKAIMLPVSAPFHSPLMEPAAIKMAEALSKVEISHPSLPVVANVLAEAYQDEERVSELLVAQIAGQVRWRESMLYMQDKGVQTLVEVGAGKVLSGLAKRTTPDMQTFAINELADLDTYVTTR